MPSALSRLKGDLEQALLAIEAFQEFAGALDYEALELLFHATESGEKKRALMVAVREPSGHFYRGRITGLLPAKGLEVLADDGELVSGVSANMILAARIQDRK